VSGGERERSEYGGEGKGPLTSAFLKKGKNRFRASRGNISGELKSNCPLGEEEKQRSALLGRSMKGKKKDSTEEKGQRAGRKVRFGFAGKAI